MSHAIFVHMYVPSNEWSHVTYNESCHTWMHYVVYEGIMSHDMNATYYIQTSHVIYAWGMSYMNACVMTHKNKSYHVWMRASEHTWESHATYECVVPRINNPYYLRTSDVTHRYIYTNIYFLSRYVTYEQAMSYVENVSLSLSLSHATLQRNNDSCATTSSLLLPELWISEVSTRHSSSCTKTSFISLLRMPVHPLCTPSTPSSLDDPTPPPPPSNPSAFAIPLSRWCISPSWRTFRGSSPTRAAEWGNSPVFLGEDSILGCANIYMYVHEYMYICIYLHITYIYICICIYLYIYINICVFVSGVSVCVCACVCVCVCVHIYIHVHMYIYVYIYISKYTHIHIHKSHERRDSLAIASTTWLQTSIVDFTHKCIRTHIRMYTRKCIHTYIHVYICIHTCVCVCLNVCAYTKNSYGNLASVAVPPTNWLKMSHDPSHHMFLCFPPSPLVLVSFFWKVSSARVHHVVNFPEIGGAFPSYTYTNV